MRLSDNIFIIVLMSSQVISFM